jgi:hypothetical protein
VGLGGGVGSTGGAATAFPTAARLVAATAKEGRPPKNEGGRARWREDRHTCSTTRRSTVRRRNGRPATSSKRRKKEWCTGKEKELADPFTS